MPLLLQHVHIQHWSSTQSGNLTGQSGGYPAVTPHECAWSSGTLVVGSANLSLSVDTAHMCWESLLKQVRMPPPKMSLRKGKLDDTNQGQTTISSKEITAQKVLIQTVRTPGKKRKAAKTCPSVTTKYQAPVSHCCQCARQVLWRVLGSRSWHELQERTSVHPVWGRRTGNLCLGLGSLLPSSAEGP